MVTAIIIETFAYLYNICVFLSYWIAITAFNFHPVCSNPDSIPGNFLAISGAQLPCEIFQRCHVTSASWARAPLFFRVPLIVRFNRICGRECSLSLNPDCPHISRTWACAGSPAHSGQHVGSPGKPERRITRLAASHIYHKEVSLQESPGGLMCELLMLICKYFLAS